jgi:cytochrome c oxidase subunit II
MRFFPESASSMAGKVDMLYFALLGITAFFMLAVAGPVLYFAVKYRRGGTADRSKPSSGSIRLETAWTVFPFVISLGLYLGGATVYLGNQRPPPDALQVNVVAKQWMWKIQHFEGRREINELHVPLGRPVRLIMTSQDVIHSFYVPAFRVKQDVLPGRYTSMWFKATKAGSYHLFCAEYCGTDHSRMIGRIVVMPSGDFERWLQAGGSTESLVRSGEQLFRQLGCSGCHEGSTVVRAPSLVGIFGRPVPLQRGGTVVADETYIRDSILQPGSQIAAGYENLMPTFQGQVSEEQILQLVAYIKSLADWPPPERITNRSP